NQSPGYHIRFHGYLIGDMVVFLTCSSMYCLSAPHGWTCMGLYLYIHMREQKDTHLTNITLVPKPDMDMRRAFACTMLLAAMSPLSASSKLYIVYMGGKKHDDPSMVTESHHDVLTSVFGSKDEAMKSIVYSYRHGFSGFAAMLTESQAATLAKCSDVVSVRPNIYHEAHTTRSWDFLGLDYDQPREDSGLLQKAKYGEDVIIGVIDSGIWPESRSFDDSGYGPVPARWKGTCQAGQQFDATSCNRKIIGARWFSDDMSDEELKAEYMSPRDLSGHGTHVASTIAGGQVSNVSYGGLAAGVARGGAPRARLAIYKVLWGPRGSGSHAGVLAALDHAIDDGVDVLSLSLGQAGSELFETLHAVERGISVVFSAGNGGPVPQTAWNAVPWVTTVAASTIDRTFPTLISLGNKQMLMGQSLHNNASMNISDFKALVYTRSCSMQSLASSNITGKIVLCYAPAEAAITPPRLALPIVINRTMEAGAKGLIFAQYDANILDILTMCKGNMACVVVDFEIAHTILTYLDKTKNPVMKVSRAMSVIGNQVLSPMVASFSSRGPSAAFPRILKVSSL
uniref:Inhibitor I9 domain-containing protein n=1 Tax=Aegilops tauschii subsp. strangulata TaxID=200361 RepID=A0A453NNV4_AEGTS